MEGRAFIVVSLVYAMMVSKGLLIILPFASSEFKFNSSFSGMYIFEKLSLKLFLRVTMKGAKLRKKNLG